MRQVPPTRDGFDARENLPRCSECHAIVSRCIVSTEGGRRHARPHSVRGVSHGDRRDRPDLRLHRAGPRQRDLAEQPTRADLSGGDADHGRDRPRNISSRRLRPAPCPGGAHPAGAGGRYGRGEVSRLWIGISVRPGRELLGHDPLSHDPRGDGVVDPLAPGSAAGELPGCARLAGRPADAAGGVPGRGDPPSTLAAELEAPGREPPSTHLHEEVVMAQDKGRPKLSEKGLLTPDNCVVTLIDFQPQMLFGVANFDRQAVINNTVALSKAARVFEVPFVLSTVETTSFSGYLWPQVQAVFPNHVPIERSSMNSWDDENFVAAVKKSGRKKIVLAGLWTETCVALPTVQAIHDGYDVYVVEDCCGDVSQLAHDNAMKRVIQAGAKPVTSLSVMLEWQRDWSARDTYDAVMDIVKTHYGAYGIGVEYAYTMVHKAPATKFPEYVVRPGAKAHK